MLASLPLDGLFRLFVLVGDLLRFRFLLVVMYGRLVRHPDLGIRCVQRIVRMQGLVRVGLIDRLVFGFLVQNILLVGWLVEVLVHRIRMNVGVKLGRRMPVALLRKLVEMLVLKGLVVYLVLMLAVRWDLQAVLEEPQVLGRRVVLVLRDRFKGDIVSC